jgi:hypothetical protein
MRRKLAGRVKRPDDPVDTPLQIFEGVQMIRIRQKEGSVTLHLPHAHLWNENAF